MDDVARAIADPVRRQILASLRDGPQPASAIADPFDISRPAISRHLRVLREAGLVSDSVHGRHRIYALDVAPLASLEDWLTQFRGVDAAPRDTATDGWHHRLDALATEVHRTRRERRDTTDRGALTRPEERTA